MAEKRFQITVDGKTYTMSLSQEQWDNLYKLDDRGNRLYTDQQVWQKIVQSDAMAQAIVNRSN